MSHSSSLSSHSPHQIEFSQKLFNILANDESNIIISPLSIYAALGMPAVGAKGQTLDEILTLFGLKGLFTSEIHSTISSLLRSLTSHSSKSSSQSSSQSSSLSSHSSSDPSATVSIANNIFLAHNVKLVEEFQSTLNSKYNAWISTKPYMFSDAETSRQEINAWVEGNTEGMIKELLQPGVITSDTLIILINAIYFKAKWVHAFDPKDTQEDSDFYVKEGVTKKVSLMCKRSPKEIQYGENEIAKWVRLQYKPDGKEFNAVFILPQEGSSLSKVGEFLFGNPSAKNLALPTKAQKLSFLGIPKFKAEYSQDLKELLQKVGITSAFADNADFSGIATNIPLHISAVIHKARIEVDEEGTVAAAATAIMMIRGMPMTSEKEFIANQPFYYLIEHVPTGAVVFIGKAYDPSI